MGNFSTKYGRPKVMLRLADGTAVRPHMFRESPKVPQGIELLCGESWILVNERKADFDRIAIKGGEFTEAIHE